MARKVTGGGKPMNSGQAQRLVKGVRLDVSPADHKWLEQRQGAGPDDGIACADGDVGADEI